MHTNFLPKTKYGILSTMLIGVCILYLMLIAFLDEYYINLDFLVKWFYISLSILIGVGWLSSFIGTMLGLYTILFKREFTLIHFMCMFIGISFTIVGIKELFFNFNTYF
ncbi:MAG: hypothetical protein CVV57_02895 [Tenericutes bacterium HGW-Tenericutes-2]|jgi:hypothetical protein|nr:MAG: hypothetical protein CVV57_02895 [Tenericutes bacterium HGW-Tenericutes-2]